MVTRSQFDKGFSRLLGVAGLLAIFSWAAVAILWAGGLYNGRPGHFWPYQRIYGDAAILLLVFVCLGSPLLSVLFSLPLYVAKFIVAGFINLDDEGIPEGDWKLFRLFVFLRGAASYLLQVLAWAVVLGILYAVDTEQNTRIALVYGFTSFFSFQDSLLLTQDLPALDQAIEIYQELGGSLATLQIATHALVVFAAIGIRFALWLLVGLRFALWLDDFFTNRVLGKERSEAVIAYCEKIADREGWLPAMWRLLSWWRTW